MQHRNVVIAIAVVLVLPLIFSALGGTQRAGLFIGVALVVVGLLAGLIGARSPRDGEGRRP